MVNNGNNKNCGFYDVMVSYIYDEVTTAERRKFETHLVDCSACTEEFAGISGARFSVFEWQKEAFAELATPEIVIPYAKSRTVESEQSGFLAGLRGLFGGYGIPVSAAAAILIWLGLGLAVFITMSDVNDHREVEVVENIVEVPRTTGAEKPVVKETELSKRQGDIVVDDTLSSKESSPVLREGKAMKAVVTSKRSTPSKQLTAETTDRAKRSVPNTRKAPALSNFDEAADKSLRLTDLFDDGIGSIR